MLFKLLKKMFCAQNYKIYNNITAFKQKTKKKRKK